MTTKRTRTTSVLVVLALTAIAFFLPAPPASAWTPHRIAGADRYATAAEISKASFPDDVDVAFLATGANFPDALAGGAAAAELGGPVLLTQAGSLPASTATELDRLDPTRIVVLGGPSVISDAVMTAAEPFAKDDVVRWSGTDRYATAAKVSASAFPANVGWVYVTTGANFPDALSAGAAAAKDDAPLLLVQTDVLPSSTRKELDRLSPEVIVVIGGPQAVTQSVLGQLDLYADHPVIRLAGPDRFATSAAVAEDVFLMGTSTAYLATGRNFPDALAGGAAAATHDAPVLLTERDCVPPEINLAVLRMNVDDIQVLGGPAAISDRAANGGVCGDD